MISSILPFRKLAKQPFRKKLTWITMAVTAVALLVSCAGLIGVQLVYERNKTDEQNYQVAEVLASNLGAAIVFEDSQTADAITHSARAVPSVVLVQVHASGSQALSTYVQADPEMLETPPDPEALIAQTEGFLSDYGRYSAPVMVDEDAVGSLVVVYNYRSLAAIALDVLPVAIVLFLACLVIGFAVSNILKRMVFKPLDGLTASMKSIRSSGDLQDRVEYSHDPDFDTIIGSYNAMLDEIEARTVELSHAMDQLAVARDEAEYANIAKSAFLANMSHELRTPLNAIIGYAEVLQDDLAEAHMTRSVEDVSWIYSSSKQLLELINSLLDLSKIEAGKMELDVHSFDLPLLMQEVQATLQPLADKQGNTLEVTIDGGIGLISSDSSKLRQSLLNLGSNACKFTENGFVGINVRSADSNLIITVSDTGIGMNEEVVARLFQPFEQSDSSTTRRYGGTGLGLALVKHFAEMLGGSVHVDSDEGYGSTFTMTVTRNINADTEPSTDVQPNIEASASCSDQVAKDDNRPVAVIMEDEPSAAQLLQRLLRRSGYRCLVASEGKAGLQIVRETRPDIILLDIDLPVLNGFEVLEAIGLDEELKAIPTVVVSVDDSRRRSLALGASDHLIKPFDTEDMEAILSLYSGKRSGRILLVEDDPATGRLYENGLIQCGFKVDRAVNGDEAADWISSNNYAAVVTDLQMPKSDGFELIRRIADLSASEAPPVLVVTGSLLEPERQRQLEAMVSSVHLKSGLTPRNLAGKITELLDA
ncbi:response regulator [uncultured Erythrobacter sp.]|uniref:response regulator n=1 Tax=uncultured Erythrobacter sp. TaxID=263913 RepID=UPI0026369C7D|nr:response regulator [uncultured Erythrobacter sp.]